MDKNMQNFSVSLTQGAACPKVAQCPCIPCNSPFDNMMLSELPVAMAYVPFQQWRGTYEAEKGLDRGTIFPELDLPFCGRELI